MKRAPHYLSLIVVIVLCTYCSHTKNTAVTQTAAGMNAPLRGTYWKLITLMGDPLPSSSNSLKEPHISFNTGEKTLSGNGGCNNFSGSYESIDTSRISFGPVISTKMYCREAKYETLFFDVLGRIDNYIIDGDTLILRNFDMDSTAKFLAVPGK